MALTKDLAPELVMRIFDFVDPPTLVLLARGCRFLEGCSRDLLRKHRDANARFHLVTDATPRTITDILRKVLIDPVFAWHVRDLEFTHARTQWSHWECTETEAPEDSTTIPPPDYAFAHDEHIALLDHLREIFHFDEQEIDKAREDMQNGNDAPLKLLLFGFCPRIRSVKFARHLHLTGEGTLERESSDDVQRNPRSTLEYFHQTILLHLKNTATAWPIGLESLRDIAIGVDTGHDTSEVPFKSSPLLVASCMNLPRLDSLYCFGVDMPWNRDDRIDDARVRYNISKGSSSVEHLFLEGARGDRTTQQAIVSGCKGLKSLTIASSDMDDIDILVEVLRENYRKSFESLMFYNSDRSLRIHGYRRSVYETEVLAGMPNLQMLYIDPEDVVQDADLEYSDDVRWEPWVNGQSWSCLDDVDFFIEYFMRSVVPNSVEVLVLGTQRRAPLSKKEAEFFDRAIAMLIENGAANYLAERRRTCRCGRHPPRKFVLGSLPNPIKAVYLESMDDVNCPPARRKRWFSKSIAAGRKHGVDVHTRTTRGRLLHQIEFPKPPSMAADVSAQSSANSSLVFNVYTGKWGPPNCGNCGKCEGCLEQYDASVWKEIVDEYGDEMRA